jgi:hypothetical protein
VKEHVRSECDFERYATRRLVGRVLMLMLLVTPLTLGQAPLIVPLEVPMPTKKTDVFVMLGSDFNRPGLLPRANYNVGLGHTFRALRRNPLGDELILNYTYENAGTHGFFHTDFGEHTESVGLMKNFGVPSAKLVGWYTWLQSGITSYSGDDHVRNRLASSASVGVMVHLTHHRSMWFQESYNKVVTVQWYTTTSVAYVYSW